MFENNGTMLSLFSIAQQHQLQQQQNIIETNNNNNTSKNNNQNNTAAAAAAALIFNNNLNCSSSSTFNPSQNDSNIENDVIFLLFKNLLVLHKILAYFKRFINCIDS